MVNGRVRLEEIIVMLVIHVMANTNPPKPFTAVLGNEIKYRSKHEISFTSLCYMKYFLDIFGGLIGR